MTATTSPLTSNLFNWKLSHRFFSAQKRVQPRPCENSLGPAIDVAWVCFIRAPFHSFIQILLSSPSFSYSPFSFTLLSPLLSSSSPQSQFQSPYGKLYILWAGDGHERAYGHVRTITKLNERTLAILLLYFISISFPPFLHIFRFF